MGAILAFLSQRRWAVGNSFTSDIESALMVGNRIERLVIVSICSEETVVWEVGLLARVQGLKWDLYSLG